MWDVKHMVKITPFITGLTIGAWIGIAQAWVGIHPPIVYGFCFLGHPSDLMNWNINNILGTSLYVRPASLDLPVLTVIGVFMGSWFASRRFHERRPYPLHDPIGTFMTGFAAANFGLLLGHCPIYVTGAVAYGSILLTIGLLAIIGGVYLGVRYVKWRVAR